MVRAPQSEQSNPSLQMPKLDPGPPSSQWLSFVRCSSTGSPPTSTKRVQASSQMRPSGEKGSGDGGGRGGGGRGSGGEGGGEGGGLGGG